MKITDICVLSYSWGELTDRSKVSSHRISDDIS